MAWLNNIASYTLRIRRSLLEKLHYIAEYNGRSTNKEIEQLIRRHIAEFENEHETIEIENENKPD